MEIYNWTLTLNLQKKWKTGNVEKNIYNESFSKVTLAVISLCSPMTLGKFEKNRSKRTNNV